MLRSVKHPRLCLDCVSELEMLASVKVFSSSPSAQSHRDSGFFLLVQSRGLRPSGLAFYTLGLQGLQGPRTSKVP